jgi:hypothetical protein
MECTAKAVTNLFSEVTIMCGNSWGGNGCWWIIILVLLFCCCGNGNGNNLGCGCGCERDNNCGCC